MMSLGYFGNEQPKRVDDTHALAVLHAVSERRSQGLQWLIQCRSVAVTAVLKDLLTSMSIPVSVLTGSVPESERVQALRDFTAGTLVVLLMTEQMAQGWRLQTPGAKTCVAATYPLTHDRAMQLLARLPLGFKPFYSLFSSRA